MANGRMGNAVTAWTESRRAAGRHLRWRALFTVAALGVLAAAPARGQVTGPAPFASVPAPTGVLVDPSNDVVVVSGATGSASVVRFGSDATRKGEVALGPLGAAGEGRLAMIEEQNAQAIALLTPAGSLVVFRPDAEPVQFELGALPGATKAPDVEAGNAPVDLDTRGARFDDVAVIPSIEGRATGEPRPVLDFFMTGVTAAAAGLGASNAPFLLRARVRLGATAQDSTIAVQGLATTTQAAVTDPAHRSGVGVYWNRSGSLSPDPSSGLVLATLPTSASSAGTAGDAVIFVGANYPELMEAEPPTQLTDDTGAPVYARSSGMTQDAAGNVYLLLATEACAAGGAPGLVAITAVRVSCVELPPASGATADYADVAVRLAGDPAYVTDRAGNAILRLPTGVQAAPGTPGTPGTPMMGSAAATRLQAALGRLGR